MAEIDPYAVLGVPRTASREEIARAYRSLVKRSHPDTGASTSPAQMARISEAWRLLGDPQRRARWDRQHAPVAPSPPWTAPAVTIPRPSPVRPQAASRMDSGWVTAAVIGGIAALVAVLMLVVVVVAGPPVTIREFSSDAIRFRYPDAWYLTDGAGTDPAGHRVIAHITSFSTGDDERCTAFAAGCRWVGDGLPSGTASVVITEWEGGEPPEPEPVVRRPGGRLDADAIIGGRPAAFELTATGDDSAAFWWQLSPPGFPDRWIEIRADLRGAELEQSRLINHLNELLDSVEFP